MKNLFSPVIFWDVDYAHIDWQRRSRFVISRVVRYGTVEDWRKAKSFYGLDVIKRDMLEETDLDDRSLSFLSCVLNIPKENFKCYTSKRLRLAHSTF
jgi:hypothetical protein